MDQIKEVGKTVLRVFFGTLLSAFFADLANLMAFDWADWQPVVYSAIAAAGVVILNALNWKDSRYGLGA